MKKSPSKRVLLELKIKSEEKVRQQHENDLESNENKHNHSCQRKEAYQSVRTISGAISIHNYPVMAGRAVTHAQHTSIHWSYTLEIY